jgi:leucyl-tRNA synthetase
MRVPTERVRELRRKQTEAERAAWHLARDRDLGAKFRRQCRIHNRVVDFYCFEHRLALERDGAVHSQPSQMRKDAAKEDHLRTVGVRLLRIPNGLALGDPEGFARTVREQIAALSGRLNPPHPARYARHPLPKGEG